MTNTTPIYWEANGLSLHTEAWSVETFGGTRNQSPVRRGEDVTLPFRLGETYVKKTRAGRTLGLPMWILPREPDGSVSPTLTQEQMMHKNWELLVSTMDVEGTFPLVKRFYDDEGDIVVATAEAELVVPPVPRVEGGRRLKAVFELVLADPWFYGAQEDIGVGTVEILGTVPTDHLRVTMTAGTFTAEDGNWMEYTGTGSVAVNCRTGNVFGSGQFKNGQLIRNPEFPEFPRLFPGENTLIGPSVTDIKYDPAYR